MNKVEKTYNIGVIIGRFQIHNLHEAHIELIQSVIDKHKKVVLFLGITSAFGTKRNPLDFPSRKQMIEEHFGDKISAILPLKDMRSDLLWSKQVDEKIRDVFPMGSVVLYGARDSFIPHYHGKFDTCELKPTSYVSGTQIREEVSKEIRKSKEFRAGIIYNTYNSYPVVHPTVDVAITRYINGEPQVLLGRKPNEDKFRFVGGFVDVTDESYEDAAKREVLEETGLEINNLKYVSSMKVADWRYRNDKDRAILTHFYVAEYEKGMPKANDDISEIAWFDINKLNEYSMVGEHLKLLEKLKPSKADEHNVYQ